MGVDFLVCTHCGETFADCSDYTPCDCDEKWCSDECASDDGFIDGEFEGERSCNYCRNEDVHDCELVEFLLSKYNLSREDSIKECVAARK